jgi:signal peptidase I
MPAEVTTNADHSISDTLQSLIVAFVLAMAFRGFVVEGFIIPTGSMAPTLMGQHTLWHSPQTGYDFRVDASDSVLPILQFRPASIFDPMVWRPGRGGSYRPGNPISTLTLAEARAQQRMGDRILITKAFHPFTDFERWDVVVFKNPTDPQGDAQNYIKRLIGLPNEKILFIGGDVFAGPLKPGDLEPQVVPDLDGYEIQRKPEYIQRTVWQPVNDSWFVPIDPGALVGGFQAPWQGDQWQTGASRSYRCDTAAPSSLRWDSNRWPLNDFTSYDMIGTQSAVFNVADLRVAAGIVPDQQGFSTTLEIAAHDHVFQYSLTGDQAMVRYRPRADEDGWIQTIVRPIELPPPGRVFDVEFWHVDQTMSIWINGTRVVDELRYSWSPAERLHNVTGKSVEPWDQALNELANPDLYPPANVSWSFNGSPVTLHHVRMDRDLFYQPDRLRPMKHVLSEPAEFAGLVAQGSPAYGTCLSKPGKLGPDQFLMCGDNSPASSDSRMWGRPDPLVAAQIGDASPFIVNRKLMLGKAWAVYFPAPFRMTENGVSFIPDFGRLRFIR